MEVKLRQLCNDIRRKPIPLADVIPTMQAAATEIERLRAEVEVLRADSERLDCGQIMIDTRDEFGEPKQVWHTGMNLRAAIDAARAAQGGET